MRREPSIALVCCGRNAARIVRPERVYVAGGMQVVGPPNAVDVYEHPVGERDPSEADKANAMLAVAGGGYLFPQIHADDPTDVLPRYTVTCGKCKRRYTLRQSRVIALWLADTPTEQVRVPLADLD